MIFKLRGGVLLVILEMILGLTFCGSPTLAQSAPDRIPEVHGTSLAEQQVNLPKDLQGRIGVLVLGFSQGSRDAVAGWGKRLSADFSDSPAVAYYEMPVLAGVPRFIRGMVIGKIKGSVPDKTKPRFVPILDNEAGWRSLAHYERGDDAYLVVVKDDGQVLWQTRGTITEESYGQLKEKIETLRSSAKTGER